jgi:hypothetical protein
VGEGAQTEATQISRLHEKLIEITEIKGIFNDCELSDEALISFKKHV